MSDRQSSGLHRKRRHAAQLAAKPPVVLSRDQLEALTAVLLGPDIDRASMDRLLRLITVCQNAVAVLTNELQHRGALPSSNGRSVIPYCSEFRTTIAPNDVATEDE